MPSIVASQLDDIRRVCRENGIRRLDLFGSGVNDTFDPTRSDLDFYVDLGDYDRTVGTRYLKVVSFLIRMFGRDIDVVTTRGVRNPDLRTEIESTRTPLYEA